MDYYTEMVLCVACSLSILDRKAYFSQDDEALSLLRAGVGFSHPVCRGNVGKEDQSLGLINPVGGCHGFMNINQTSGTCETLSASVVKSIDRYLARFFFKASFIIPGGVKVSSGLA
ncbi:hypothetical protein U7537_13935 [Lacticaseibacillus rhamnosus]